jgi:hypothetical protein
MKVTFFAVFLLLSFFDTVLGIYKSKYVKAGGWRTLETFWNDGGKAWFHGPAGARIKVNYGVGWFSKDRQKQTLDGQDTKKLNVSKTWALLGARMLVKVEDSTTLEYACIPSGSPENIP